MGYRKKMKIYCCDGLPIALLLAAIIPGMRTGNDFGEQCRMYTDILRNLNFILSIHKTLKDMKNFSLTLEGNFKINNFK